MVLIPTNVLKARSLKFKNTHGSDRFCYYIWINPVTKEAFDYRDKKLELSDFLDKKGISNINEIL